MQKTIFLLLLCLFIQLPALAQSAGLGTPPFGSFSGGGFDTVNNGNLNVYFPISIVQSAGRGMPLNLTLSNNSLIWTKVSSAWAPVADASGNPTWGWAKDFPGGQSRDHSVTYAYKCFPPGQPWFWTTRTNYNNFYYIDVLGTTHNFSAISFIDDSYCSGNLIGTTAAGADDLSGYYMDGSPVTGGNSPIVTSPGGIKASAGNGTANDTNGNYVTEASVSCSGCVETDWTDSVGNKALKIIYTPNTTSPTSIQYKFPDGNGNYQTITLKLQAYNIKTNFLCSAVLDYTGTAYLPYELDIPSPVSGTMTYLFAYEGTPGNSGYYTGRLQQVTLPTGGYYKYTYGTTNDGINCTDGTTLSMTRTISDGTNSGAWTFVRNSSSLTTTVTTPGLPDIPNAFDTIYTFNSSGQEISRKIYKESPGVNILRTVNTTWAANGSSATMITILEDGSTQNEVATTYDSNGLLDSATEYDWGSGSPGAPLRTTTYSYQTSANYTSRHIINLVTSKIIKDGSGTVQYRQDIAYDVGTLTCPTGVPQHYDTSYPCSMPYRGNPTAVTTYLTPTTQGNPITKNFTYDWFGNLLTAQLNCCQSKTWNYSATTQYSQPDSVVSGLSPTLTTSYTYSPYTGLMLTSKDPNNLVTSYSYDFLRRPLSISVANGQSVGYSYNDTSFVTTVTTTIDSSKSVKQVSSVDGLGRVLVSTTEDGSGNIISNVSANYDLLGRAYRTSNPYTGSPSYWATTALDVLGRPTSVTLPDNSATGYAYAEQYTTITDPAGKKRKSQVDGAGRLVALTEPDTSGNLVNTTYYTFTVLDALRSVADAASNPTQTRTYGYDALGRLISTVTPEGGQTCFGSRTGTNCNQDGYDSFDNLSTRTDARGVVTSYTYDGLNRLKGVSYNVGSTGVPATASVSFTYGTNASQYNNGLLITMTDGVGSENYSYNALEQLTQLQKVIGSTTYTTSYAYNIAGELTQITYPSGRIVQQSVDAIGRLCEIAPSTTGCGTAASPYATGYSYSIAGQVTGFKYGNGIYASLGFSSDRLQLNCLDYSPTNRGGTCAHDSTTKFGLSFSYGTAGSNNGLIAGITDSVDNGRSVAYTYDPLSRLSKASTTGSSNYPRWGLSWGYDRYGNRQSQTLTAGSGYQGSVQLTASSNQINCIGGSGQSCTGGVVPTYDANGNMTYDGSNTLVYDAENKVVSATNQSASGTYTYDGNGYRVQKVSGGTTTVYGYSGSKVIAEYDGVGGIHTEYIYGGSSLVAKIGGTGISNGGFEQGLTGWSTWGSATLIADPTRAHSGSNYAQLSAPVNSGAGDEAPFVAVKPGDQITFGGWVYLESGGGGALGWWIVVEDTNHNVLAYVGTPNPTSSGWMYQSATYSAPSGAAYVALYAQINLPSSNTVIRVDDGFLCAGTSYYHQDHLSNRLVTDSAGNTLEQMGHYPFGDPWYNGTNDKLYFTSYERDSESSNDYAQARFYRWLLGRFLSLDPLSGSTSDPQSLNRYTYVENDPIDLSDPSGLCPYWGPFLRCGSADTHVIDPYATLPGITYIDITLGPPILYLNVDSNGAYQVSQNYDQELSVAEFGNIYATVFSLFSSGGGNFTFDFLAGAALRENFKAFLKAGISQDCINALTGAFGPNALDQLAQAIDSTTFFNVNALSPQPVANYWGSGNGPMTLGNAFTSRGSGAVTKTGSSNRGYQPGIYTWNGASTFADSPYFLLHEVTHVLQGSKGVPGNLDVASVNQFGVAVADGSPNAASNAVSKFFNNKCAGYNQ